MKATAAFLGVRNGPLEVEFHAETRVKKTRSTAMQHTAACAD